jgi:hypothetical protein
LFPKIHEVPEFEGTQTLSGLFLLFSKWEGILAPKEVIDWFNGEPVAVDWATDFISYP